MPSAKVFPAHIVEAMVAMYRNGASQDAIGKRFGASQTALSRILRSRRIPIRGPGRSGPASGSWKGGRTVSSGGYLSIKLDLDDPLASMRRSEGYVLEHRLMVARALGRPLERTETVHHINGDKLDNHPENLQLRQGRHGKGVALRCRDCGSHNIDAEPLSSITVD